MSDVASLGSGQGFGDDDLWGDEVLVSNSGEFAFPDHHDGHHHHGHHKGDYAFWEGMDIDPEFMSEDEIAQHAQLVAANAPAHSNSPPPEIDKDPEAIEKMRQVIVHHLSHGIEEKKREIELIDYRLKLAEDTWERLQIAWSRKTFDATLLGVSMPSRPTKKRKKKVETIHGPVFIRTPDGRFLQIKCPSCGRETFANLKGFTNHCRIVHKLKFENHFQAAETCGHEDESEVPPDDPCRQVEDSSLAASVWRKQVEFEKLQPQNVEAEKTRFYLMKKVIVGNTSQLITKRDGLHTHKWMVYVRGTKEDPDVSKFIKKVRFFLHPSFKPGDVVEISQPPFHLTRKGWGECPVRVQLHFWDARNKPINVVHRLHLEKHMSALQTLGEEQIVDVELDRAFYESSLSGRNSDAESGTQQPANEGAPSLVNGNHGDGRQPVDVNMPGLSMVKSEMDLRESANEQDDDDEEDDYSESEEDDEPRAKRPAPTENEVLTYIRVEAEKTFPLISEADLGHKPYSVAKSHKEWYCWSVGKRKSCEYQRARRLSLLAFEKMNVHIPTKEVMQICREFDMTPPPYPPGCEESYESLFLYPMLLEHRLRVQNGTRKSLESKIRFCRYCGCPHFPFADFETLELRCGERALEQLNTYSTFAKVQQAAKGAYAVMEQRKKLIRDREAALVKHEEEPPQPDAEDLRRAYALLNLKRLEAAKTAAANAGSTVGAPAGPGSIMALGNHAPLPSEGARPMSSLDALLFEKQLEQQKIIALARTQATPAVVHVPPPAAPPPSSSSTSSATSATIVTSNPTTSPPVSHLHPHVPPSQVPKAPLAAPVLLNTHAPPLTVAQKPSAPPAASAPAPISVPALPKTPASKPGTDDLLIISSHPLPGIGKRPPIIRPAASVGAPGALKLPVGVPALVAVKPLTAIPNAMPPTSSYAASHTPHPPVPNPPVAGPTSPKKAGPPTAAAPSAGNIPTPVVPVPTLSSTSLSTPQIPLPNVLPPLLTPAPTISQGAPQRKPLNIPPIGNDDEIAFIRLAAAGVGADLGTAPKPTPTEHLLAGLLRVFVRNVALDTYDVFKAEKEKDNPVEGEVKVMVPFHMYKAIVQQPELDFLTNNGLESAMEKAPTFAIPTLSLEAFGTHHNEAHHQGKNEDAMDTS